MTPHVPVDLEILQYGRYSSLDLPVHLRISVADIVQNVFNHVLAVCGGFRQSLSLFGSCVSRRTTSTHSRVSTLKS